MNKTHSRAVRGDAISYWNELLASSPEPEATLQALLGGQREADLFFEGRPFCAVARPRFVTRGEMEGEHRAVSTLAGALRKVRDAVLEDRKLHAAYLGGLFDWVGTVFALEPRVPEARSILRFDSFTGPDGIRFVELNGDIPMGGVVNDALVPLFRRLGFFPAFEGRYEVRPNLVQIGMTQTFVHAWQGWGGTGTPRICVLSFPGGMQEIFGDLTARQLQGQGLDASTAHPEHLDFRGGTLYARGRAADLVYRIMHTDDCLERRDEVAPLLEAVRHRAVCMVNPFRSELLSHKFLFALLTDGGHDFRFTPEESAAIRVHIPWGRVFREGFTAGPDGERVDLVEYSLRNREGLVLKPAHAAGGAGVHLGWTCDGAQWEAAVREALAGEYVVQEKVPVTREEYPALEAGFPLRSYYEDTDPFHFPGGYASVLTRISSAEITNVAQGGSILPTFVLDAK